MSLRYALPITFALLLTCVSVESSAAWSYEGATGPSNWVNDYPTCGAGDNPRQSPIDINTGSVVHVAFAAPQLGAQWDTSLEFTITNNGHSLSLSPPGTTITTEVVIDGETVEYTLANIHFHWGESSSVKGSEHTVDGDHHQAEMHCVHYRSDLAGVSAALAVDNGLMVLGAFIDGNAALSDVPTSFDDMVLTPRQFTASANVEDRVTGKALGFLPTDKAYQYNYDGGLTTPGCTGVVQWFVYASPVVLPQSAVDSMFYQTALDANSELIHNNYRPTQDLGSRQLRSNNANYPAAASIPLPTTILLFLAALAVTVIRQ